jgi:hypothetical protein
MPIEDPRRDSRRRDELRVGGWLESLPRRRALPGRPPLVTPPPPRVPVFRPLRPRTPPRRPIALPPAAFDRVENPGQVRLRVALTCLAATAVGAAAFLVLADRAGTAPPLQQMTVADPVTLGAIPPASPSSPAASRTTASSRPRSAPVTSTSPIARHAPDVVHHTTAPSATPRPARLVVVGGLRVGATVRLEAPGGATSRAGNQHAVVNLGSYVVRKTASAGCVAFEAAGRPGYFLRHRDFVLRLEPADGTPLFRLDSSFCPVTAAGGAFRLRSVNYPDRFLTAGRFGFVLAQIPVEHATEFTAG